jgi:peptide/nickel transport system ATP-binding protein
MRLLEVSDLTVSFPTADGVVQAVRGVSFGIDAGRTLGVVGESGSGKSVAALSLLGLSRGATVSGSAIFEDTDLLSMAEPELRAVRGARIAMVFQDPLSSLHPLYKVGWQIAEAIRAHTDTSRRAAHERAIELLGMVGIPQPRRRVDDYPHQFSGGMRQRVMIAMALSLNPRLIIADEPTTALDATVQIQILLLLRELQREFGMSVIFVTHDIGVAIEICDRVAVMYAGQIVEQGMLRQIVRSPVHPYAKGLLASTVHGARRGARLETIPGTPPSLDRAPHNCSFAPRCSFAQPRCNEQLPPNVSVGQGRTARCILATTAAAVG